jgi:hypothetical protein
MGVERAGSPKAILLVRRAEQLWGVQSELRLPASVGVLNPNFPLKSSCLKAKAPIVVVGAVPPPSGESPTQRRLFHCGKPKVQTDQELISFARA